MLNCPLDGAAHPHCPLAANIYNIVQRFEGLAKIYQNMQTINCAIAQRLRGATANDSSVNAIVTLDSFAQIVPFAIEESLEELRYLFSPYALKKPNGFQTNGR